MEKAFQIDKLSVNTFTDKFDEIFEDEQLNVKKESHFLHMNNKHIMYIVFQC